MLASETDSKSLRERKKARTRRDLVAVASRLFRKQGYAATTLEQIARQADVSLRTLPRYFETKRQLALAGYYDSLAAFRGQIEAPKRRQGALLVWRRHVAEGAAKLSEVRDAGLHAKFVVGEVELAAGLREVYQGYEDVLCLGLAQDARVDAETDLYSRLLAGMLVSGSWGAMRRWVESDRKGDLVAASRAIIDFAEEIFPARSTRSAKRLPRP